MIRVWPREGLLVFFGGRGFVMPERRLLASPLWALAEDFEVVTVVHDADDVAERVDPRRGDEPGPALPNAVELLGAEREQSLKRRGHVVDVPIDNHPAGSSREPGGA